jgi:4'-phosphopantetheinyl transferase EntD
MLEVLFRRDLAGGRCVAVRIPAEVDAALLASLPVHERALAERVPPGRRPSWVAGRVALRKAAGEVGHPLEAILATTRGAPALPDAVAGSISHKRDIALGLAVPRAVPGLQVGVDLERDAPPRIDISHRVLTDAEAARMAALDEPLRGHTVMLHLSAKESVYKAVDPVVGRYVGFKEAELSFEGDGTIRVALSLTQGEGPFRVSGWWTVGDGLIVTAVRLESS